MNPAKTKVPRTTIRVCIDLALEPSKALDVFVEDVGAALARLGLCCPADYLLEVGCGGGALLKDVLRSGCRAAAVDHSPDMVRLAQEVNRDAVSEGRLEVRQASADQLPYSDATFTCAVRTGVLGFLPNPVAAFREIRRVRRAGGRFVTLGGDSKLRGTPAAPEPMASRLRFYEDDELHWLAQQAGFQEVRVERRDLERFARDVGIPEAFQQLRRVQGESPPPNNCRGIPCQQSRYQLNMVK